MSTMNKRIAKRSSANVTGFTLVELLVVVGIVIILVAILIPSMQRAMASAKISTCASNLKQLGTGTLTFASDHNGEIPPVTTGGSEDTVWPIYYTTFFMSRWSEGGDLEDLTDMEEHEQFELELDSGTVIWGFGHLWYRQYVRGDGHEYFCPAQTHPDISYERYKSANFPDPDGGGYDAVRLPYQYNPMMEDATNDDGEEPRNTRVSELDGRGGVGMLLGLDTIEKNQYIAHARDSGWNIMRGDLSTRFVVDLGLYNNIDSKIEQGPGDDRRKNAQRGYIRLLLGDASSTPWGDRVSDNDLKNRY